VSTITKTIPAVNTATGKPRYSSRGGAKVRLLILHTMEGARTVDACGAWFRNPAAPNASSHVGIDDDDTALYVPYEFSAWTAASANPVADQAELAAFAAWTPAEWDAHAGLIERTAQWVAERAKARGIPLVRLRDQQTKTGTGVCMHVDITRGWGVGTHTDCGASFPIDRIIARAIQINGGDDDVLKDQTITNPVSGQPETLDVTIAYLEERVVESLKAQLPALVAKAVLDSTLTSEVDHKTQGTLRQFIGWIDRATNLSGKKLGI